MAANPTYVPALSVTRIYNQMRNDCTMDITCSACGTTEADKCAYNDHYYINTVVPSRKCKYCENLSISPPSISTPLTDDHLGDHNLGLSLQIHADWMKGRPDANLLDIITSEYEVDVPLYVAEIRRLRGALHELRAVLCGVGVVGTVDGHEVIRRSSVIELVDARRQKMEGSPAHV